MSRKIKWEHFASAGDKVGNEGDFGATKVLKTKILRRSKF